jgi:hypothetical protein
VWGKPKFESVEVMRDSARAHADSLPIEYRFSLPIPAEPGAKLKVAFLFSLSRLAPGYGAWMLPPSYRVLMDAQTAGFIVLESVTPETFGRHDPPNEFLGAFNLPPGMTGDDYKAQEARLFEVYDLLLPEYAAGSAASREIKYLADEFVNLFAAVMEPPLAPYYEAAGKQFFAWLRRTRR